MTHLQGPRPPSRTASHRTRRGACLLRTMWPTAILAALVAGLCSLPIPARATAILPGDGPTAIVRESRYIGRTNSGETVDLALVLPLRNTPDLSNLLHRLYNPHDPLYGHYLTPRQFAAEFGPTPQQYAAVEGYAINHGLIVTRTHPNRTILDVRGTAGSVENAFGVSLANFVSWQGIRFHAPLQNPSIPDYLVGTLTGVAGLSSYPAERPVSLHPNPYLLPVPHGGSGPSGGLTPDNVRTAYNLKNAPMDGSGQVLGLFELDGYTPSDVTKYEQQFNLPNTTLENHYVDGFTGLPSGTGGEVEVTLDIDMMLAVAPKISKLLVYESPNNWAAVVDQYNQIANDDLAPVVSSSWGLAETEMQSSVIQAESQTFTQMAVQGQSNYAAAGDSGAYDDPFQPSQVAVDNPASQPMITGVGGTTLTTNTDFTWNSEKTWGSTVFNWGGGGGISTIWPIPSYQQGVVSLQSGGSTTMRNVPDVALNADPVTGYDIYVSGWQTIGGTSAAAPLWAGFSALVNQERALNGTTNLGFANPLLYTLGQDQSYATLFHDINDGSTNLFYQAVTGYDDATGWGTFNGAKLLPAMAPNPIPPTTLTINPPSVPGGSTATATVTLTKASAIIGVVVTVTSSNPAIASVPAKVIVPTGALSANFTIQTAAVRNNTPVTISATADNVTVTAPLTVTTTPPAAPKALTATVVSPTQVLLTWIDGGGYPTSFEIQRMSPGGSFATVGNAPVSPNAAPGLPYGATDSTVSPGGTYTYRVVAVNAGGASAPSAQVTVTTTGTAPAAPINLTATAVGQGEIDLTWQQNGSVPVTSYVLERRLASGTYAPVSQNPLTTTSYKDTGLLPGTTYYYHVKAMNAQGSSPFSTEVRATTQAAPVSPPKAPAGLTAAASGTQIVLNWTDNNGDFTGFKVERRAGSGSYTSIGQTDSKTLSFTDTNATPSVNYTYRVKATNTAGDSPYSNEASATINADTITGLVTIAIGSTVVSSQGTTIQLLDASGSRLIGSTTVDSGGHYSFSSLADGTYTVRASALGQVQTRTVTLTSLGPLPGQGIANFLFSSSTTLPAGLSLVSVPFDYSTSTADAAAALGTTAVSSWNPLTQQKTTYPNLPGTKTVPGQGYWVQLPAGGSVKIAGTPITSPTVTITLQPGWNLIGNPYLGAVSWSRVTVKLPFRLDTAPPGTPISTGAATAYQVLGSKLYGFTPTQGMTNIPGPPNPLLGGAGYTAANTLQPYQGYWIYLDPFGSQNSPITMTFPNPSS